MPNKRGLCVMACLAAIWAVPVVSQRPAPTGGRPIQVLEGGRGRPGGPDGRGLRGGPDDRGRPGNSDGRGPPGDERSRRGGPDERGRRGGPGGRGPPSGPDRRGRPGDPAAAWAGRGERRPERPNRGGDRDTQKPGSDNERPLSLEAFSRDWRVIFPEGTELPPNLPPKLLFMELDVNRNRYLDPEELRDFEAKAQELIATAKRGDLESGRLIDKNREMSVEQFMKRSEAREPEEDARILFKQLDRDGSGGLSKIEMRKWYKDGLPGKGFPKGFAANGGAGDGKRDKDLTFHDFETRYINMLSTEKDPHGHHKLFMQLDANGDLLVSKKEMEQFPKAIKRIRNEV